MLRAASVWAARKATSLACSASSVVAIVAMACRAALAAPASPMAKVATGTPLGICTMDSSESSPRRYLDGTGTPKTGTSVSAAIMPGRWAAPPAPAMMARRPRACATAPYSAMSWGMRCAEITRASKGTPKDSSIATAFCMTSQSLEEPMMTPTRGEAEEVFVAEVCVVMTGSARHRDAEE